MGRYVARSFRLREHNERACLVFDSRSMLPEPLSSTYLVVNELGSISHTTLAFKATVLAQVVTWADQDKIDLIERFRSGRLFSHAEAVGLARHLMINHKAGSNIRVLRVGSTTHAQKVRTAAIFFRWLRDKVTLELDADDQLVSVISLRVDQFINILEGQIVQGVKSRREGLSHEEQAELLRYVHPDTADNPFKPYNRHRNYIIILMYIAFGLRLSELLKVALPDLYLNESEPYFKIYRKELFHDDRLDKPVLKTLGRDLPLSPDIARMLQCFLVERRKFRASAKKSPFLILNSRHSAKPMSKRQVDHICEVIRDKNYKLTGLTPHRLRHTWNDNFNEAFDQVLSDVAAEKYKNYLCGWASSSKQSVTYELKSIRKKAAEMSLSLQERLMGSSHE